MNEETLKFICWITGHDEETIKQMYSDYSSSPQAKSIPMQLPVILQGELLPCPFCGEDEWEKLGETYFLQHNYDCFIRNTSEPLISKTILINNTESIWWNKRAGREPQSK